MPMGLHLDLNLFLHLGCCGLWFLSWGHPLGTAASAGDSLQGLQGHLGLL